MSDKPLNYAANSPMLKEMKKSQIMYMKYEDHGVRKLSRRIKDKKRRIR